MAFLNLMKKREKLPADIDLDMPPEPPKMMAEESSLNEPIDEELMPAKFKKAKVNAPKGDELPELPPLPDIGKEELPPVPKEEELGSLFDIEGPPPPEKSPKQLGELDLPPPPKIMEKKKKGFFKFLKPKKAAEELPLPPIGGEIPEMPPLPEAENLPEIPREKEEIPPMLELEKELSIQPPKMAAVTLPPKVAAPEPLKPIQREVTPKVEESKYSEVKKQKFITLNDFKQVRGDINGMKGTLKGIDSLFCELEGVKGKGDKEYSGLYNSLKDIQSKIMFVDKRLFKEV